MKVFIFVCCLAMSFCLYGKTNHVFRYGVPLKNVITSDTTRVALTKAAATALKQPHQAILAVDVIAWSLKVDDLDLIPRVFEDAVILVKLVENTNSFELLYMYRSLSSGPVGESWRLPSYPPLCVPPVVLMEGFKRRPSEAQIANFIRASDFGCNNFDSMVRVADVVLYPHSQLLETALTEGITDSERAHRQAAHRACFFELLK